MSRGWNFCSLYCPDFALSCCSCSAMISASLFPWYSADMVVELWGMLEGKGRSGDVGKMEKTTQEREAESLSRSLSVIASVSVQIRS